MGKVVDEFDGWDDEDVENFNNLKIDEYVSRDVDDYDEDDDSDDELNL